MNATHRRIHPFVNGKPSTNGKPLIVVPSPAAPESSDPAPEPAVGDRDAAGRFQPGCKAGPGNPFGRRVAALRKALLDSVSEADMARLGRKLLAQAEGGDVAAAKVLLGYVVGKPAAAVDPDRVEVEAWKILLAWPSLAEAIAAMGAVRPDLALETILAGTYKSPAEVLEKVASPQALQAAGRVMQRRELKGK